MQRTLDDGVDTIEDLSMNAMDKFESTTLPIAPMAATTAVIALFNGTTKKREFRDGIKFFHFFMSPLEIR